jgi:hypothetical protein
VIRAFEDACEEASVRRVLRLRDGSGLGVARLSNTQHALDMSLVPPLVIVAGSLASSDREDAVRVAYAQGASVLFVFGNAGELLADYEGIAAELYYNLF